MGVNKYRSEDAESVEVRYIDNFAVLEAQKERLQRLKDKRDIKKVNACLEKLTEGCKSREHNLLALAIDAADAGATVGEITLAMEQVFGRYIPKDTVVRGVY